MKNRTTLPEKIPYWVKRPNCVAGKSIPLGAPVRQIYSWHEAYPQCIAWYPARIWMLSLKVISIGKTVILESDKGTRYTMFLSEFERCVKHLSITQGRIERETFVFIKRSNTYSLSLVTLTDDDPFKKEDVKRLVLVTESDKTWIKTDVDFIDNNKSILVPASTNGFVIGENDTHIIVEFDNGIEMSLWKGNGNSLARYSLVMDF